MKNINNIVLIAVATLAPRAAYADTADIMAANNQAGIQITSEHISLSDNSSGVTDSGNLPGFALSASMMKNLWLGNDYIEAGYGYNSGNTNVTGAFG